jgi:hypothetical protein
MLGKNAIGVKDFVSSKRAFGDNALPFTKEIRQNAGIGHLNLLLCVGDGEAHRAIALMQERTLLDKTADTQPLTFMRRPLRKLAWPVEKDDIVAQCDQDQPQGEAKRGKRRGNQNETAFSARHDKD